LLLLTTDAKSKGAALSREIGFLRCYGNRSTGEGRLPNLASLVQGLKGLESLHLEDLDGLELRQFVLHNPSSSFSSLALFLY
jgi:hypothetical protein